MDNFEKSLFHNFVSEFFQYCREMTDKDEIQATKDLVELFYSVSKDLGVYWLEFDYFVEGSIHGNK